MIQPGNSIFNNPVYIGVIAVPFVVSMASGAWALWVQGLMTARNVVLIPMLGYVTGAMLSLSTLGFFYGVFDRTGFFQYRTPHSGYETAGKRTYLRHMTNDKNAIVEGVLAVAAIVIAVPVLLQGVWFLSLSLVGFGIFTLKSMSLSRYLRSRGTGVAPAEGVAESVHSGQGEVVVAPRVKTLAARPDQRSRDQAQTKATRWVKTYAGTRT